MPQFDMIILPKDSVPEEQVLPHAVGSPARQGGGDETYRCGRCKTKLLVDVPHREAHGVVVRCGKCKTLNTEPHHHH